MVCLPLVQMVRRVVLIQLLPTLQKRPENLQQLIATRRRSRPQSLRAKFLAKPATGLGFRYLSFSSYYVKLVKLIVVSCFDRTFNSDNALESHSKAKHGST